MKKRLMDLLEQHCLVRSDVIECSAGKEIGECSDCLATWLIENGVIVPPCNVGDTVYTEVYGEIRGFVVMSIEMAYTADGLKVEFVANNGEYPMLYNCKNIGKTVFLNRKEAEEALAERSLADEPCK